MNEYSPKHNFNNGDETGLFYRMLPIKTFAIPGDNCVGGKLAEEHLTFFVCANMKGRLEKPCY